MFLSLALLIALGISSLFIGILIYIQDSKNSANRNFALFSIVVTIWILTNYLVDNPLKNELAIFWNRLNFVSAMLMAIVIFLFSFTFPRTSSFPVFWKSLYLFVSSILLLLILFTDLGIKSVEFFSWGTNAVSGVLFYPGITLSILSMIGFFINIGIKYKHSDKLEKRQLKYILYGLALSGAIGLSTNAFLPIITGTYEYAKYGPYGMIFLLAFTAYAISKHHLFDIRVIITEVLTALISLGLLIDALLSSTFYEGGLKGILFVLVSYGGYRLVLSVREEIRRRQEIQQLTDQLKHANIRLKELDRLKSEFLSVASHELNSPMAIIMGYLHMILWEGFGKVDENARQYLEKVYFKAQLLAKLVADLLNVSRIEQGRLKIEIEPVDLGAILKDLCEDYATQAKEKGLSFAYHEPKQPLPKVLSDIDKLKEIIQNLLSNAVKFTKTGGVEVNVGQKNGFVEVSVKDTGIGIPKEAQKHIGEKFYRVDNSLVREVGGTGLGLHLVQQYLNLMHGKFWFESEGENKGTTFYFTLPVAK